MPFVALWRARRFAAGWRRADVVPSTPYGEAIVEAIEASRLMVLVFSSSANNSSQVMREVERAVSKGIPIIPLRMEDVPPSKSLEYFLSAPHWLDALTPPLEKHLHLLAETVDLLLVRHGNGCNSRDGETGPCLGTVDVATPTVTNSIGMKLALVEPGVCLMGSSPNESERENDEHLHEVEITRPFYVGVYEVTQEQYQRVMGQNPSYFSSTGDRNEKVKGMDTRLFPVESVSWGEAVEFCRRLSELPEEKANEHLYRLPTEADWEYICRGGPFFKKPSSPFYFGNSLSPTQANYNGNFPYAGADKGTYMNRPTTVGCYPPNPLGLHDLHGNVWEWCADWYGTEYYKWSPRQDPPGPENGERRVVRGGSWCDRGRNCRAACRSAFAPGVRDSGIGFRVVLVAGARP